MKGKIKKMKVKIFSILICMFMCTFLVLCTSCQSSKDVKDTGKQTAEAWLQNSENDVRTAARVDLSDGWSVEFASGAVYLYDKEIGPGVEAVAMCVAQNEEVYNDYVKAAKASDTFKETDDYIYYEEENECAYLYKFDKAYFLITVKDKDNANDIVKRFSLIPETEYKYY